VGFGLRGEVLVLGMRGVRSELSCGRIEVAGLRLLAMRVVLPKASTLVFVSSFTRVRVLSAGYIAF
jgi:hypothetical protein